MPTSVFLHGFCENKSMWEGVIQQFEGPKLSLDLPGFGARPLPEAQPTLEWWARFVHQYIQDESIDDPILIGHSMGGYIALEYARLYPSSLSGLGLIHSHCFEDSEEKKEGRKKVIDFVSRYGIDKWLPDMAKSLLRVDNIENDAFYTKALSFIEDVDPESVIAGQTAMLSKKDRSEILRQIDCPVLLIGGTEDSHLPFDKVLEMSLMPDQVQISKMSGSGHLSMVEERETFVEKVNQFIDWVSG
jgi:pimeloyl-ACP methyl ester carboxylesterase